MDYSLTVRDENTVSWNDNAPDSSALSDLEKERSSKTPVTVGIPLTAGDRFLGEQREAIQAIIAELIARNLEPKDYIVDSTELEGKKLRVYLRNFQHASEDGRRGDSCGKCRMAYYDLQTKELAFTGIR